MKIKKEVVSITHYQGIFHVQLSRYRFGSGTTLNCAIKNAIEQGKRLGL